jgi:hypothetical protein
MGTPTVQKVRQYLKLCFLLVVEEGRVDLEAALQHGAVLKCLHCRQIRFVIDVDTSHTDYEEREIFIFEV